MALCYSLNDISVANSCLYTICDSSVAVNAAGVSSIYISSFFLMVQFVMHFFSFFSIARRSRQRRVCADQQCSRRRTIDLSLSLSNSISICTRGRLITY